MNQKNIIIEIRKFLCTNYFFPGRKWPDKEFEKRSYERLTAYQIIDLCKDSNDIDTLSKIEEYYKKMHKYYLNCDNDTVAYGFKIQCDVSLDILNFLKMEDHDE